MRMIAYIDDILLLAESEEKARDHPTMPGLHDQSGEDDSRAIPDHGIPGIHGRHQENGTELTSREDQDNSGSLEN